MPDIFYGLAALACPVGMGAMMWFMGKGMRSKEPMRDVPDAMSLAELREEHRRLAAEIELVEATADKNGRPFGDAP